MSRSHAYGFIFNPGPKHDHMAWWDKVEAVMHPRWPDGTCQGGSSCSAPEQEHVTVWFYCNKAKARRISEWLHRQLGLPGDLIRLGDGDEPDEVITRFGVQ